MLHWSINHEKYHQLVFFAQPDSYPSLVLICQIFTLLVDLCESLSSNQGLMLGIFTITLDPLSTYQDSGLQCNKLGPSYDELWPRTGHSPQLGCEIHGCATWNLVNSCCHVSHYISFLAFTEYHESHFQSPLLNASPANTENVVAFRSIKHSRNNCIWITPLFCIKIAFNSVCLQSSIYHPSNEILLRWKCSFEELPKVIQNSPMYLFGHLRQSSTAKWAENRQIWNNSVKGWQMPLHRNHPLSIYLFCSQVVHLVFKLSWNIRSISFWEKGLRFGFCSI